MFSGNLGARAVKNVLFDSQQLKLRYRGVYATTESATKLTLLILLLFHKWSPDVPFQNFIKIGQKWLGYGQ